MGEVKAATAVVGVSTPGLEEEEEEEPWLVLVTLGVTLWVTLG